MNPDIEKSWKSVLWDEFNKPYFHELKRFLKEEKQQHQVFPPGKFIFNAYNLTPFDQVKVVLLGQDPYHNVGQAHGLCFSVQDGIAHPRSLINIFKELQDDLGYFPPENGNLEKWAKQGVLLLNAILTVRAHEAGSHQGKGWENFTDATIRSLSEQKEGLIFLLWGNYAQAKSSLIDTNKHYILKSAHPSPLSASRGFFGCKHFSQVNRLLQKLDKKPIDWKL
ncbi:uracil-DNA glycosylase [Bacteroidales bacterium OttesenSCG-928-L19]|nr:uracil-DNA glycosylase [Bacteroidales bacterium OttesenSCG-928-L19]